MGISVPYHHSWLIVDKRNIYKMLYYTNIHENSNSRDDVTVHGSSSNVHRGIATCLQLCDLLTAGGNREIEEEVKAGARCWKGSTNLADAGREALT
jgi:hypothetical protein